MTSCTDQVYEICLPHPEYRDSLFMGWYADLMESQDSLDNVGKMIFPNGLTYIMIDSGMYLNPAGCMN